MTTVMLSCTKARRINWIAVARQTCALSTMLVAKACAAWIFIGSAVYADATGAPESILAPSLKIGVVSFPNGRAKSLSGGLGGGATLNPDGTVTVISDQGPAFPCKDAPKLIELEAAMICAGEPDGQVHPIPDFNPVVSTLRIENGRAEVVGVVPVTDRSGRPVTGLPNPLSVASTARVFGAEGQVLGRNPAGLNPQSVLRLPDGSWLVGDAHAPSLVFVDPNGAVRMRLVPVGMMNDVRGADYPVEESLPTILLNRGFGTGFSGLGLAANGRTVFAALAGPLDLGGSEPPFLPILEFDLAGRGVASVRRYPLPNQDTRILEMVTLGKDRFLVVEGQAGEIGLFELTLGPAEKAGTAQDLNDSTSWPLISKRRIAVLSGALWSGMRARAGVMLPGRKLLLIVDGDYGLSGQKTLLYALDLSRALPD